MSDLFKVVTRSTGTTAFAGESTQKAAPKGVTEKVASADCERRNAQAVELGIEERYDVVPFAA